MHPWGREGPELEVSNLTDQRSKNVSSKICIIIRRSLQQKKKHICKIPHQHQTCKA